MTFAELWAEIAPIGRDARTGGYVRYALTEPELVLRDWFRNQADRRGMTVTEDGNGNLFAWWGDLWGHDDVLTGSHFDSVPHGGGYDGPLGIVSAFLAVDRLPRDRRVVVAAFAEPDQKVDEAMLEIGVLGAIVVALALSTYVLRRKEREPEE